jgi:RES domain-containing protein
VRTGSELDRAVSHLPTRPLRGTYFRACATQWVADPLGKGRTIGRNRFNVAGGARVLYTAEDPHTCLFELQAYAWPPQAISIVPILFRLDSVVDLRDAAVQQLLQTDDAEIAFNFRSVPVQGPATSTQALGEAIARSGRIDGLLFPSFAVPRAAGHKQNLAIVEAGVTRLGSHVEAEDPLGKISHRLTP